MIRKDLIRITAAFVIPPFVGTAFVYLTVVILKEYGWTLFVLAPALMGFVSAIIYAPKGGKPFWKCLVVSLYYFLFISFLVLIFAIEGLVCVAMSLPLAIPLDIFGVWVAYLVTNRIREPKLGIVASLLLVIMMPFILGFEISNKSLPTPHKVVSTIEIDAPIEKVWKNVVEFPEIDAPPE